MKKAEEYAEEYIIREHSEAQSEEVFLLMKGFIAGFRIGDDYRMQRVSPYEYIIETVSIYYDIPIDIMKQKTRKREIVFARQVSFYLGKIYTNLSLYMLGVFFDQDHSTALHGINVIENLIFSDRTIRLEIKELKEIINEKLMK